MTAFALIYSADGRLASGVRVEIVIVAPLHSIDDHTGRATDAEGTTDVGCGGSDSGLWQVLYPERGIEGCCELRDLRIVEMPLVREQGKLERVLALILIWV